MKNVKDAAQVFPLKKQTSTEISKKCLCECGIKIKKEDDAAHKKDGCRFVEIDWLSCVTWIPVNFAAELKYLSLK